MEEIKELFEKLNDWLDTDPGYYELTAMLRWSHRLSHNAQYMVRRWRMEHLKDIPFLADADWHYPQTFGQCGDQLYWKITDYILHIGGTGDMWDFESSFGMVVSAPWRSEDFDRVVIHDGVTSIGAWAFEDANLKTIEIPASMKEIRTAAFLNAEIDVLNLPGTLEFIGPDIIAADPCRVSELVLSCDIPYIAPEAFYIRYGNLDKITLTGNMPENLTALVESHLFRFVPGKVLYPRVWDTPQQSFPDLLCAVIEEEDEILSLCEEDMDALRKVLTPYDT